MRHPRVLIVDDDPGIRRVVRLSFPPGEFEILSAADGIEALEVVDKEPVDAVVLDLEMPQMDGRTFYTQLRRRGSTVPVLVLSAYGAVKARREIGADSAMPKPFDPDTLVAEVQRLIDERPPQPSMAGSA